MTTQFSNTISTAGFNISSLFCTEKLKNAHRKFLQLRNKHSVFVPNVAIFILERNLIWAFDHVMATTQSIKRYILKFSLIFVKLHVNTRLPLSLKLTFSSQNRYQKFLGEWLAWFLARRANLLVPDDRTGFFSSPAFTP